MKSCVFGFVVAFWVALSPLSFGCGPQDASSVLRSANCCVSNVVRSSEQCAQQLPAEVRQLLSVLSDDQALAIRGQGWCPQMKCGSTCGNPCGSCNTGHTQVFGNSAATVSTVDGGAHSENGYVAEGSCFAAGTNLSYATFDICGGTWHAVAGGSSTASAR